MKNAEYEEEMKNMGRCVEEKWTWLFVEVGNVEAWFTMPNPSYAWFHSFPA